MKRRSAVKAMALTSFSTPFFFSQGFTGIKKLLDTSSPAFKSDWESWPDIKWIGPEFWGNRLQDWEIIQGKAVCNISAPNRTLHILTHQLGGEKKDFQQSVIVEWKNLDSVDDTSYLGFRLGAKGIFEDYRSAAVFGKGLDAGVTGTGQLMIGEKISEEKLDLSRPIYLSLTSKIMDDNYRLMLSASYDKAADTVVNLTADSVSPGDLQGNLALVCHGPDQKGVLANQAAFSDWVFQGEKIVEAADQVYGPIFFAQYTLHRNTLKLTAQLAPLELIPNLKVELQLRNGDSWETVQSSSLDGLARIAKFRINDWNREEMVPYRVHIRIGLKGRMQEFSYHGQIAEQPHSEEALKVAVFSCNADHGFPDQDVVRHVAMHKPQVALFLGDQFYEGTGGFGIETAPLERATLDYLRKWYMFGWSYREIFRNIPAAIIPDDHDVYHGNVWGEGGKHAPTDEGWGYVAQDQGGYKMPAEWVNMIQQTQTSHLPDPFDPTEVQQGIGVYYTDWEYGGVSFAILEDRKFKSAPQNVLPEEAKVMNGFIQNRDFDIRAHYDIDADLLGKRQMDFLQSWTQTWRPDVHMKAVLSQTNFCTVATLPEGSIIDSIVPSLPTPKRGEYVEGDAPTTDMDSNGWPQKGRDEAVRVIRKAFALHIAGDQHLASTVQYGVDEFRDSGYAFAGPALNNLFPRRFWPTLPENHQPLDGKAPNTGDFEDGFGNKMTVYAVANPHQTGVLPSKIHDRSTGYGIVTFDKKAKNLQIDCWPRYVDPTENPAGQFEGWPITINQSDNYGRKAVAYLDTFYFEGLAHPLVTVINDSTGELEYNLRVTGDSFQPKVFTTGAHTVKITDLHTGRSQTYASLTPLAVNERSIQVEMV